MSPVRTRVLLVDDHALVMAGYVRLLELESDVEVVGQFASAESAYAALQRTADRVDLVMLDLSMPGRSGLELLRRIQMHWPRLWLLVCTMHDSPAMVRQALEAGAHGFITKCSDPALLPEAIRTIVAGRSFLSPDVRNAQGHASAAPPHEALSPREFDVFIRLVRGDHLDQIAQTLHIAPKTAANLQTLVRAKLGLSNGAELLRYARQHRIVFD
jgi:DNA-binding NarL/FixJ family response regulator